MFSPTHKSVPADLIQPLPDSLYRLVFIGGPFDGHEAQSDVLPDQCVALRSDGADGEAAEKAATPLLARYRLQRATLVMQSHEPVVWYRYHYCGTEVGRSRPIVGLARRLASWLRFCGRTRRRDPTARAGDGSSSVPTPQQPVGQ